MEIGTAEPWQAWAKLAGLSNEHRQVIVDPTSAICPDGWVGVLAIGRRVAAAVPAESLREPVAQAIQRLSAQQAITPEVLLPRLPAIERTLGPAHLFYAPVDYVQAPAVVDVAAVGELAGLVAAADADEVEESGIAEIHSSCFVSRTDAGRVAAACGYLTWPNGVAHLSVLSDPNERQQGHGFSAAVAAIESAIDEGLLPQWRARFEPSMRLARKLGLQQVGAQFSLQLA